MSKLQRENVKLRRSCEHLSTMITCLVRREGRVVLSDEELREATSQYEGITTQTTPRGLLVEVVPREQPEGIEGEAPNGNVVELAEHRQRVVAPEIVGPEGA